MFCPKCKAEYKENVVTCADCLVPLVEVLSSAVEQQDIEFEEILATYNPGDIAIIKSILDGAGIPYYFQNENFVHLYPLVEPARLIVPRSQVAEAQSLLKDLKLSYEGISIPKSNDKSNDKSDDEMS